MVRSSNGCLRVYVPPPGPAFDDLGRRRWQALSQDKTLNQFEVDAFVATQTAIDPDIWVIDIDDETGFGLLDEELIE